MIRFGWDTFKARPWFFGTVLVLVSFFADASAQSRNADWRSVTAEEVAIIAAAGVVVWIVQTYAKMGRIRFLLKAHDAPDAAEWKDLWAPHPFWRFVFASVLYGLIVLGGLILLVVPGIVWGVKYQFVPYIVMERDMRIWDAFRESDRITEGYKWKLLGFGIVLGLLILAGFLFLLVGALVAIPVAMLAYVRAYRVLQNRAAAPSTA